jgi:hypothetical protein
MHYHRPVREKSLSESEYLVVQLLFLLDTQMKTDAEAILGVQQKTGVWAELIGENRIPFWIHDDFAI